MNKLEIYEKLLKSIETKNKLPSSIGDKILNLLDNDNISYKIAPKLTYVDNILISYKNKKNYPQSIYDIPVKYHKDIYTLWLPEREYMKYIKDGKNIELLKQYFPNLIEVKKEIKPKKNLDDGTIPGTLSIDDETTEISKDITEISYAGNNDDRDLLKNIPPNVSVLDIHMMEGLDIKIFFNENRDNESMKKNIKTLMMPMDTEYINSNMDKKIFKRFFEDFNLKEIHIEGSDLLKYLPKTLEHINIGGVDTINANMFNELKLKTLTINGEEDPILIESLPNTLVKLELNGFELEDNILLGLENLRYIKFSINDSLFDKKILPDTIEYVEHPFANIHTILLPNNLQELIINNGKIKITNINLQNFNPSTTIRLHNPTKEKIIVSSGGNKYIYNRVPYTNIYITEDKDTKTDLDTKQKHVSIPDELLSLISELKSYFIEKTEGKTVIEIQDKLFNFASAFKKFIKTLDTSQDFDKNELSKIYSLYIRNKKLDEKIYDQKTINKYKIIQKKIETQLKNLGVYIDKRKIEFEFTKKKKSKKNSSKKKVNRKKSSKKNVNNRKSGRR